MRGVNDHAALAEEEKGYRAIPTIRLVQQAVVKRNYEQIKQDVRKTVIIEMEGALNDPSLTLLVMEKK